MYQSTTNGFGFEKKTAVFVAPGRTSNGVTSYVSARMSGVLVAAAVGAGVAVGRYSGATTLQPDSTAASSAPVTTPRIRMSLDPSRAASGGYGVANFAARTALTAIAESTDPK